MAKLLERIADTVARQSGDRLQDTWLHRQMARYRKTWPPLVGDIRFGDLGSTRPASYDFGYDRGNPIDRYYIENFLASRSEDIAGRVLEVAEDTYSRQYGGSKITRQDVLHLNKNDPNVTISGDLTQVGVLPDETFDCIILTQTLQYIFALDGAVERLHAALKPGGILLLTVPGITPVEKGEWGAKRCWSFTGVSIQKLFEGRFGPDNLQIATYGNFFAAVAYLFGAAVEEIDRSKLDVQDATYPVIVTLRAKKR